MKISAKSQYACVAMIELALHHEREQPVPLKRISESHSISPRFLVQILLQLKTAGLVQSVRGASGGYQLAESPERITLAQILDAVEDRGFPPLLHVNETPAASALGRVWQEIREEEQRILEGKSLADLVRDLRKPSDFAYQI